MLTAFLVGLFGFVFLNIPIAFSLVLTTIENSLKGSTKANPVPVNAENMRLFLTQVFEGKLPA